MRARRRWALAALLFALLIAIATFPMRLALTWAGADDAGITARDVHGSIWSGMLVDAQIGALPLGTIQARLSPLALLAGRTELMFSRTDSQLGALSGRLHGSGRRGASDVNGITSLSGGLGLIPIDTIRFEDAAARFDTAGRCTEAGGRIQLSVAAPIAGLDLSRGLSGPLRCADGRAEAALASQSGMERLRLSFDGRGVWRARFAIGAGGDPVMVGALSALGFRAEADGFVLATSGRF